MNEIYMGVSPGPNGQDVVVMQETKHSAPSGVASTWHLRTLWLVYAGATDTLLYAGELEERAAAFAGRQSKRCYPEQHLCAVRFEHDVAVEILPLGTIESAILVEKDITPPHS
jgi:hypothetical protein